MLGYFFSLMMTFYSPAPYLTNQTIHFLFADMIAALTNIGLNFILIKTYGIMGAAYSTLIAFFFGSVYLFVYSSRVVKVKYEIKKLILVFLISVIIYLIGKNVNNLFTELTLIVFLILVGLRLNLFGKNFLNVNQNNKF
jgi:O-antigen/teichoic acid export membrane protein